MEAEWCAGGEFEEVHESELTGTERGYMYDDVSVLPNLMHHLR